MSEPMKEPIQSVVFHESFPGKVSMTADAETTGNPSLPPIPGDTSASATPKMDPLTQVQQMFVEAAKSDQAMATTFSKLLSTVEELREQNRFVIANLRALILRLSDSGTIKLTASELESFGVSKKAAVIRSGR